MVHCILASAAETPAQLMLQCIDDCLHDRPPNTAKLVAARTALLGKEDVYQVAAADLAEQMDKREILVSAKSLPWCPSGLGRIVWNRPP